MLKVRKKETFEAIQFTQAMVDGVEPLPKDVINEDNTYYFQRIKSKGINTLRIKYPLSINDFIVYGIKVFSSKEFVKYFEEDSDEG